jgi:ABC-2 type transport system permease protein
MNARIIWAIFCKDLVDAVRNTYILFALLLPLGTSLLLSVMMPAKSYTPTTVQVAVYDPGQSQYLESCFDGEGVILRTVASEAEAEEQASEDGVVGVVLPADFDRAYLDGRIPKIRMYYNSDRSTVAFASYARMVEKKVREQAGQTLPIDMDPIDVSTSAVETAADFDLSIYMLILFLVMSMVMTGVFVVPTILVEEKEKQTLQAVLVTPAGFTDLIIGKSLVGMVYALLSATLLLVLNNGFVGSPAVTLSVVVLGSLFLVLVGLLLGAVFKTTAQVNTWSSITMLALLFPAMFVLPPKPPEPIPTIMQWIPTSHIASALAAGLHGDAAPATTGIDLLILAGCALVAFLGVWWALRRERR